MATVARSRPTPVPAPAAAPVVVVDERRIVRLGLAALVRDALGGEVLAVRSPGAFVRLDLVRIRAAVVGLPTSLPPETLAAEARSRGVPLVLAVSPGDRETVDAALAANADGYLSLDSADADVVHDLLAAIARGERRVPRELTAPVGGDEHPPLTERCVEVLRHLVGGLHDEEIAAAMGMSTNTVRKHVRAAELRLGARTRVEAVAIAVRTGLLD